VVELLGAVMFLGCWAAYGRQSVVLALIYAAFLAALLAASFIDWEHFFVPDQITLGGMVAGLICSVAAPGLHGTASRWQALGQSVLGLGVGVGVIYAVIRGGKLVFGRYRVALPADTRIVFTETGVHWEGQHVAYEELFYRQSDEIALEARRVEMVDRCYKDVAVRLTPSRLRIGNDEFDPESVPHLEAVSRRLVLPREAMGLGDAKFMGLIGAFLGWQAVLFCLMVSSLVGSVVGVSLKVLGKLEGSRLPYCPYLALAAAGWVFGGREVVKRLIEIWWGR
jgi:leader peptidase (prepilin peptidase)/N-methyltransferase